LGSATCLGSASASPPAQSVRAVTLLGQDDRAAVATAHAVAAAAATDERPIQGRGRRRLAWARPSGDASRSAALLSKSAVSERRSLRHPVLILRRRRQRAEQMPDTKASGSTVGFKGPSSSSPSLLCGESTPAACRGQTGPIG